MYGAWQSPSDQHQQQQDYLRPRYPPTSFNPFSDVNLSEGNGGGGGGGTEGVKGAFEERKEKRKGVKAAASLVYNASGSAVVTLVTLCVLVFVVHLVWVSRDEYKRTVDLIQFEESHWKGWCMPPRHKEDETLTPEERSARLQSEKCAISKVKSELNPITETAARVLEEHVRHIPFAGWLMSGDRYKYYFEAALAYVVINWYTLAPALLSIISMAYVVLMHVILPCCRKTGQSYRQCCALREETKGKRALD